MYTIGKNGRLFTIVFLLVSASFLEAGITFSSDDAKLALAAAGVKLNVANGLTVPMERSKKFLILL